ncbi:MAG: response regulator transcription factor [Actinomycetota bacterium]
MVADDQEDFRLLIKLAIGEDPNIEVVGEARDGDEAVALARSENPDAVLLDLAMPGTDGLRALPLIRAVAPTAKVVVVSAFEEDYGIEAALKLGAADYIVKGAATATEVVPKLLALCGGSSLLR